MDNADDKRIMTQPEKIEYIIKKSCEYLGIDKIKLQNRVGTRSSIWHKKRYIIMILDDYTVCNHREIGCLLGYANDNSVANHIKKMKDDLSGELYGSQKTKMVYNELLTYLNLKSYENKETSQAEKTVG